MTLRGLRNNNPGNIKEFPNDRTHWVGERATDDDPIMEEFDQMWQGVRAARIVFQTYQRKYGLDTVDELIGRWAPPGENNTKVYRSTVCGHCGVNGDTKVDTNDLHFMNRFLRSVFRQENGPLADTIVTDNDMILGLQAA